MSGDRPAGRVSAWWLLAPTVLFVGNFLAALSVQSDQSNLVYQLPDIIATAVVDLLLAGYALLAVRVSGADVAGTLALRPLPLGRAVRLVLGAVAFLTVLDLVTDPFLNAGKKQGIAPTHQPQSSHQWLALGVALVALVVVAPLAEELIFRGLCFAAMGRYALVGSSALFALAHGLPVLLAPVFVAGLVIGWVRARTGSLYPGLAVHMLLNATALVTALLTA